MARFFSISEIWFMNVQKLKDLQSDMFKGIRVKVRDSLRSTESRHESHVCDILPGVSVLLDNNIGRTIERGFGDGSLVCSA